MVSNLSDSSSNEKVSDIKHVDEVHPQNGNVAFEETEFTPAEQRKIFHKIDRRLIASEYCADDSV